MEFTMEKKGITFHFRNPTLNKYDELIFEYKIVGYTDNGAYNEGFLRNARYKEKVRKRDEEFYDMIFFDVIEINGNNIRAVQLIEPFSTQVRELSRKLEDEAFERKLNQDIIYVLNSTTAYGIYNGINGSDIGTIVYSIKKQLNTDVCCGDITRSLNQDQEIKKIAMDTYTPYPEGKNLTDESKIWHREHVKDKTASGYGIIPNEVIKKKITSIIIKCIEEENIKKLEEETRINSLFELAKETGKAQKISEWHESCNDPKEECNLDICVLYAMPDGTKSVVRNHTF